MTDQCVILDVGGEIFKTSKSTLLKLGENFFSILLNNTFNDNNNGWPIFIDRDPKCFSILLEFMRMGTIYLPNNIHREKILEEAKYFGIEKHLKFHETILENYDTIIYPLTIRFDLSSPNEESIDPVNFSTSAKITFRLVCKCNLTVKITTQDNKSIIYNGNPRWFFTKPDQKSATLWVDARKGFNISSSRRWSWEYFCKHTHPLIITFEMELETSKIEPAKKKMKLGP